MDTRRQIQQIQQAIIEENIRIYNEKWAQIIDNLEIKYNEPKIFWNKIERLMGGTREGLCQYIWGSNNEKLYKKEEQINRFKEVWEHIFEITEEENRDYDEDNERRVTEFLVRNKDRTEPYELADLGRLAGDNYLTAPVEIYDILAIIARMKNKAPGESGINKVILKNLPRMATERLAQIVNILLSMGYFSVKYKNGMMIFTQKENKDARDPLNYRPITLLEIPGKMLERIINDRVTIFMEENNKLNVNQYGFRKGYGTEMALCKIYEKIAINQNERGQCNIVCRDVAKAFDKVWHEGLKYKILHAGLPGIIERILCNFLDDRSAVIKKRGIISERFNLKSGVPQGSILSPTLFIYYTSDLPRPGPGGTGVMFADDVTQIVGYPHSSKRMLALRTEREINRVNTFEKQWKIKTNKNKFKLLSVSKTRPATVSMDGRVIPFAPSITTLGFPMKRNGFNNHIAQRLATAKGRYTKLKRFAKLKPKKKAHLYKSLARSAMEYPNIPLCLMSDSNANKFQKFQNKILRKYIKGADVEDLTIEQLHGKCKIEPLNLRMNRRAKNTWTKFERIDQEVAEASMELNNSDTADHYWWRRIGKYIGADDPVPRY